MQVHVHTITVAGFSENVEVAIENDAVAQAVAPRASAMRTIKQKPTNSWFPWGSLGRASK